MTRHTTGRYAILCALAASLSGCGIFDTQEPYDWVDPKYPDKTVARMDASVTCTNNFADEAAAAKATYRASLYGDKSEQFYGPKVLLSGVEVPDTNDKSSTIYLVTDLEYTPGKVWRTEVQGHQADCPPAFPAILITWPLKSPTIGDPNANVEYHRVPAGSPLTVRWKGGDPGKPVYLFVYGNPDNNGLRRLFPQQDPAVPPRDVHNFGLPIPNTGEYTIPGQITERYTIDGQTLSRTTTTFDNPNRSDSDPNKNPVQIAVVYVMQWEMTNEGVIRFATISSGTVTTGTPAYK